MKTKRFSVALIVICTLAHCVFTQDLPQQESQKKSQPASTDEELKKRLREQQVTRILAVLSATADNAKTWTDAAAASKVQAQISDVIWDADADIARGYLIRAWETAGKVETPKRERSPFRNQSPRTDARREVILVARKRAPDLSKKWLQQMAQESEQDQGTRGAFDDRTARSTLLLQMAMQVVEEDPNGAATLAIESLQDGISFGFQQVLIKIQEKNVELSQRVFRAALARLRSAGMLDPNELLILYAYLYTPGRIVAANTDGNTGQVQIAVGRNPPQIAAAAQLNPALALDFLQLAANLLINAPLPATTANPALAARSQLSVINGLMGPISEQLPELGVALRTRAQQISTEAQLNTAPQSPPANRPASRPGETSESYAERRVDLLEDVASNGAFTIGRDIAYAKAALATTVQNYQRGWNLAGKVEDATFRDNLKNWLTYRATLHFINQNNLEKAYELAAKNADLVQRAASLVVGAQQLIKIKDKNRASHWLVEARSLLRKVEPDETSVHVAFGIVSTFAKVDPVVAFDVLSEAVRQMGKTTVSTTDDDRVPLLKRFSGFDPLPDFTFGSEGFSLRAAISAFGPEQFEDVLGVVNRITPAELHGLAIIELSRKYLKATQQI
jgi:hypothetical protein